MQWLCAVTSCAMFALIASGAGTARSHEFWIDPVSFTPKTGVTVPIVFRIGSDFRGGTYPFVRALSARFSVVDGSGERSVKALDGDDPAADIKFLRSGLSVVVHERKAEEVVFQSFAKFEENLNYEGLESFTAAHKSRGRPMVTIRELYSRHAKALVNVGGEAVGMDRAVGMALELVAEKNPYALAPFEPLPVQLLFKGKPVSNVLVKTFSTTTRLAPRLARTDADGRVTIDISTGGEYLISAVHMTEPPSQTKADWVSFWASLTFAR
jgi:hypothetical protein